MVLSIVNSNGIEHPDVQRVIHIAEEILNQNKSLTTEILYNTARNHLNLSRRYLLSIIKLLFNKKVLVEGSKYTRESIILNPSRRAIYDFIMINLGVCFSLMRKDRLSWEDNKGNTRQLIWHLELLLKFKYIKKLKVDNFTIFLPIDIDDKIGLLFFILRDELNKKILNLFIENRKLKKVDIYKLLDEPTEHIYNRLKLLIRYEILTPSEQQLEELILSNDQKKIIKEIINKIPQHNKILNF